MHNYIIVKRTEYLAQIFGVQSGQESYSLGYLTLIETWRNDYKPMWEGIFDTGHAISAQTLKDAMKAIKRFKPNADDVAVMDWGEFLGYLEATNTPLI